MTTNLSLLEQLFPKAPTAPRVAQAPKLPKLPRSANENDHIVHRTEEAQWIDMHRPETTDLIARMISKIQIDPVTGCWNYIGANSEGYPAISVQGTNYRGNRLSHMLFIGPISPASKYVCHKCDTPGCINPMHLWQDTPKGNTGDMIAKGRGGKKYRKLTAADAVAIRQDPRSHRLTAADYGVSHVAVINVRKYKTWKNAS